MIFETIMLACFGLAWPFSIYKAWKSREVGSQSFIFLFALVVGYISGIVYKIFFDPDWVVWLYGLNAVMVTVDIVLLLRNRLYHIRSSAEQALRSGEKGRPPAKAAAGGAAGGRSEQEEGRQ